jgi:hypothetical protein
MQLLLRSETRYYSQGSIIADSREDAKGLIVITSGQVGAVQRLFLKGSPVLAHICVITVCQVGAELPVDSEDAVLENQNENGNTLLLVFERGYRPSILFPHLRQPKLANST